MPEQVTTESNQQLEPGQVEIKGEVYWERRIDLGDGSGVQVFRGRTEKELVDELVKAQTHASRKIKEQSRQIKTGMGLLTPDPEEPIPQYKPRTLTPDEQWQITRDLSDPSKALDAIVKVWEARTGVSVSTLPEIAQYLEMRRRFDAANLASDEWVKEQPEYYATERNRQTIIEYLGHHKMAITKKNLDIAYQDLRDSGLLEVRPETPVENEEKEKEAKEEAPPEPIAPVAPPAPRARTTMLRPGGTSVSSPAPAKPTVTWAAIDKMSSRELEERLRDPVFRKAVDTLPPR